MSTILELFDRLMLVGLVDKVESFINWPSSEYIFRRCYGLELASAKCRGKHDWNRGPNAPKTWKSKVDWDACRRVDPRRRGSSARGRWRTRSRPRWSAKHS